MRLVDGVVAGLVREPACVARIARQRQKALQVRDTRRFDSGFSRDRTERSEARLGFAGASAVGWAQPFGRPLGGAALPRRSRLEPFPERRGSGVACLLGQV